MHYLHFILLSIFIVFLRKKYSNEPLARFIYVGFCLKILAGVAYGWLYMVYYGGIGDSLSYFEQSSFFARLAVENPSLYVDFLLNDRYILSNELPTDLWNQPRALLMIKFTSLLNLVTQNDYWIAGYYLSLLSFWGMWYLANTLATLFPSTWFGALVAFLLFPSVLIWSAGYTKETFTMAALGFSIGRFLRCIYLPDIKPFFWISSVGVWLVCGMFLFWLKFYYLAVLIPSLGAFCSVIIFLRKIPLWLQPYVKGQFTQFVLMLVFFVFIIIIGSSVYPNFEWRYLMTDIVTNHNRTYIFSLPDDVIHFSVRPKQGFISLSPTWWSFIYNAPYALFSTLFRPFLWESLGDKLKIAVALENFVLSILLIYSLCYWWRKEQVENRFVQKNYLLAMSCILYISVLFVVLAFSSPNFGSLARYKIAAMPFYIYLVMLYFPIDKWLMGFRRLYQPKKLAQ